MGVFLDECYFLKILYSIIHIWIFLGEMNMNGKTYTILGWVFLLVSGLIYTLERLRAAIVFVGANVSKSSFQASPEHHQ